MASIGRSIGGSVARSLGSSIRRSTGGSVGGKLRQSIGSRNCRICHLRRLSDLVPINHPVTLDNLLETSEEDSILPLDYAADEELIDAILFQPTTVPKNSQNPYDPNWQPWLDPADAFAALRVRPSFHQFMQHVRPRLERVYSVLQTSSLHEILASDLLLHNGGADTIRELLEIDAHVYQHIRSSVIVALYEHIQPALNAGYIPPLTELTNKIVARALMKEGDTQLLPRVFENLYATLEWRPSESWELFSIILHMNRMGANDEALRMTSRMSLDHRIPSSGAGRSDPRHPEAKSLLVQSIVLRSALQYRLWVRSQAAVNDLLETIERSGSTPFAMDLLYEAIRATIFGKDPSQVGWARKTLARITHASTTPLPGSMIDAFVENCPNRESLALYKSIQGASYAAPSAKSIITIASACDKDDRETIQRLLAEIARLSPTDFVAQRPMFNRVLIKAEEKRALMEIYRDWRGSVALNSDFMLSVVRLFAVGKHANDDFESSQFAIRVVEDFAQRHPEPSISDALSLARAYLGIGQIDKATEVILPLDTTDSECRSYILALSTAKPLQAYNLIDFLRNLNKPVQHPREVIIEACIAGKWFAFDEIPDDRQDEVVDLLRAVKKGETEAALSMVRGMEDSRLYHMLVSRCLSRKEFSTALKAWKEAPKVSQDDLANAFWAGERILRRIRSELKSAFVVEALEGEGGFLASPEYQEFLTELQATISQSGSEQKKMWDKSEDAEKVALKEMRAQPAHLVEGLIEKIQTLSEQRRDRTSAGLKVYSRRVLSPEVSSRTRKIKGAQFGMA